MRFHKHVSKEAQELLTGQLKEYERTTRMTKEERRELHKWVASGRSPYENGSYVCAPNGCPADFISALRFESELQEWFGDLTEEERQQEMGYGRADYNTEMDEPVTYIDTYDFPYSEDNDLPFQ